MCLTELELPNQHAQYFLPRTLRQSLSCVLIPFPCVLPGSRVEFCQWCALVRCSPFCLTFLFVPFAPRHHRTSHHGISTHLLHFGVTGFLLSPIDDPANGDMSELEKYPFVTPNIWPEMLQLEDAVKATDRLVFDTAMLALKHAVIFPSV